MENEIHIVKCILVVTVWKITLSHCFYPHTDPPPGCGDPGTPENGRRLGDNFTVGAVVFFRCNDDYDLVDSKFRICQENGLWSGTQPTCQPFNGKFCIIFYRVH